MMKEALLGPFFLLQGVRQLWGKSIKRFLLIPIAINLVLFSLLIVFGFRAMHHLSHHLPHYLHWLSSVFEVLFFLISTAVLVYFFSMITNFIGAPFNSLLSSKMEQLTVGKKPFSEDSFRDIIKDLPRFFKRERDKIFYYIPRALLLLVLFFIPVINVIAGLMWILFNSWMMAIQYLDYPMDNHKMTFQHTQQFLREHRFICFTFGISVLVAAMIPIVNLIIMPAAVIGATHLYLFLTRSERE